jgi:hypothetical protein
MTNWVVFCKYFLAQYSSCQWLFIYWTELWGLELQSFLFFFNVMEVFFLLGLLLLRQYNIAVWPQLLVCV